MSLFNRTLLQLLYVHFFFFLLLFSLFTGPLPLSTVLLLPLRNDEKSTEPLIGSVNPIEGTRTLMGWCRLEKERMEERWNDEAWVTSTGKIRYGNTTFRENNFHYSCMPFLLRSFVFSFFFFVFFYSFYHRIFYFFFFFLKTRFVAVLVHSIWTCLDTWSPWYSNQRLRTKREIFFTHWNVKSKNDRSSKNSYTFLLQFSFTWKNTM